MLRIGEVATGPGPVTLEDTQARKPRLSDKPWPACRTTRTGSAMCCAAAARGAFVWPALLRKRDRIDTSYQN
jgi:hypothetical protein